MKRSLALPPNSGSTTPLICAANGQLIQTTDFVDICYPFTAEVEDFLSGIYDNDRGNPDIYETAPAYPIQKSYYTQDILGSTMSITGIGGYTKEEYSFDAFGTHYDGSFGHYHQWGDPKYWHLGNADHGYAAKNLGGDILRTNGTMLRSAWDLSPGYIEESYRYDTWK